MKKIRKNSIPFYFLLIVHSFLLGATFYKNRNRKNIIVLLFVNIGFSYIFEYFIFNLLKVYKYKPKMLKKNFFDNTLGALMSQAIFIPFTAVFLTGIKSGWTWKVVASVYFFVVEKIFLKLGIFKHYGWKTIYTLLLLPIYFTISDLWYDWINKKNAIVRFISLFLMIIVSETNLFLLLAFFRKFRFGVGRYHPWKEHFIVSPLYSITLSLFTAWIFLKKKNESAYLKVVLFALGLNKFFTKVNLLKDNLRIPEYFLIRIIMTILYGQYRTWVYGESNEEENKNIESVVE